MVGLFLNIFRNVVLVNNMIPANFSHTNSIIQEFDAIVLRFVVVSNFCFPNLAKVSVGTSQEKRQETTRAASDLPSLCEFLSLSAKLTEYFSQICPITQGQSVTE